MMWLACDNGDLFLKDSDLTKLRAPRWGAPSGPNLPRERVTTEPVVGEVVDWKDRIRKLTHADCFRKTDALL